MFFKLKNDFSCVKITLPKKFKLKTNYFSLLLVLLYSFYKSVKFLSLFWLFYNLVDPIDTFLFKRQQFHLKDFVFVNDILLFTLKSKNFNR